MLIAQGGYAGEIVKRNGKAAGVFGPVVFASEERVNKKTPAQRNQLWDHEAVHVQQQWRNGWWILYAYPEQHIRHGYDGNMYEEEARAKAGEPLRSTPKTTSPKTTKKHISFIP